MSWKTDLFRPECNIGIDINAIPDNDYKTDIMWTCPYCHEPFMNTMYDINHKKNKCCARCSRIISRSTGKSLQEKRPDVAATWHPLLNKGFTPDMVSCTSNMQAWWHCYKCGFDWQTDIYDRCQAKQGAGCPVCSHRLLRRGFNDLMTTYPDIARQWFWKMNGNVKPCDVMPGTKTIIVNGIRQIPWWHCKHCNGNWQATCLARTRGDGCPYCNHQRILTGFNDLQTLYPEVAAQWHPVKNGNVKPCDVMPGTVVKYWWLCPECGKEWQSAPNTRVQGHGCPACAFRESNEENELADELCSLFPMYADEIKKYRSACFSKAMKILGITDVSISKDARQKEMDIFIPSLRIAFEYNGDWWHGDTMMSKRDTTPESYHKLKRAAAEMIGIRLAFIWEHDWLNNHDEIIESIKYMIDNPDKPIPVLLSKLKI